MEIRNKRSFYLGCFVLLIGYTFYLFVRGFDPLGIIENPFEIVPLIEIKGLSKSLPTFLHVLSFCLISHGLFSYNPFLTSSFWVSINLIFEYLQHPSSLFTLMGTFTFEDVLAAFLAGFIFLVILKFCPKFKQVKFKPLSRWDDYLKVIAQIVISVAGISSIMASSDTEHFPRENAIYLSYEELRRPLTIQFDRPLKNTGKIYTFNNYLFISEPNQGIHIYDNSDTTNPISKGFIVLPGNLDIAIKNGFLFADSFIDLVIIDLSNPVQPILAKRIENVFPYDAYQVFDPEESIYLYNLDESKGVVIGLSK